MSHKDGRVVLSAKHRYAPPPSVAHAAAWALELRAMLPPSRRCCTPAGLRTAKRLAERQPFTRAQLVKLWSYHQRHRVDEGRPGWGVDSKGWQASLAWGGAAGEKWAARILDR